MRFERVVDRWQEVPKARAVDWRVTACILTAVIVDGGGPRSIRLYMAVMKDKTGEPGHGIGGSYVGPNRGGGH